MQACKQVRIEPRGLSRLGAAPVAVLYLNLNTELKRAVARGDGFPHAMTPML